MKNDKKYLLVETDTKTKNDFKAFCAKNNITLKKGIDTLMRTAVKGNRTTR